MGMLIITLSIRIAILAAAALGIPADYHPLIAAIVELALHLLVGE